MSLLPTGHTHFKGFRRQIKQSNYDLMKALCEPIDNIIVKCKHIHINFRLSDKEKGNLSQVRISDDYPSGFEGLFEEGTKNPFNPTHMRDGQEDDQETSQFGIGLKAGAISMGDKLDIFTQVKGKYYQIEMDFLEMCERETNSFSPTVRELSKEEYQSKHPFDYGSTLVLSSIHPSIYGYTTESDFQNYLMGEISDIYNEMIKENDVSLHVNDKPLVYKEDIYNTPECAPFTRLFTIYKSDDTYVMTDGTSYHLYDHEKDTTKIVKKDKSDLSGSEPIATIQSTFTYFSTATPSYGVVHLNRKGRRYGSWTSHGSKNNGAKNYNLSRVDFDSKFVAKQLGLTFNKDILESLKNKETQAFHCFIDVSVKGFNADTSTATFTKLLQIAEENNILVPERMEDEKTKKRKPREHKPKPKPDDIPVSMPEVEDYIETELQPKPEPKKKVVGPYIKGGLTDEQLDQLLKIDRETLKYHPAMIHAYNEMIMKD